ncbi:MAG: hypothetical protein HQK83_19000 [Fibrobacteria bacterium]|nr:hypothetical protein [Fibrobacteria bacterium]
MIKKIVLNPNRIRRIPSSFGFIPHRFLTEGFLASLKQQELVLYWFLILASDAKGLSFYNYKTICKLLKLSREDYLQALDGLLAGDLIAFDGTIFQVLELPLKPVTTSKQSGGEKADGNK